MHSDCAFYIGKTHRVCQDYAVAGEENGTVFVLLADGFSSSPDTDIGARLLVHSARRFLPSNSVDTSDWAAYHEAAIHQAAGYPEDLGLAATCLDATLMTIKAANRAFTVCCHSDGAQPFTETLETDTSRTPCSVPLPDVLVNLLAFKGSRGEFVQRRVTAFFKDCAARHRQHHDDFSLGVVWLGEP